MVDSFVTVQITIVVALVATIGLVVLLIGSLVRLERAKEKNSLLEQRLSHMIPIIRKRDLVPGHVYSVIRPETGLLIEFRQEEYALLVDDDLDNNAEYPAKLHLVANKIEFV
jgi:hypothetical protein